MGDGEKCPQCGKELINKKSATWSSENNRCWVCPEYPQKCSFKKLYTEKREIKGLWERIKESIKTERKGNNDNKCPQCGSKVVIRKRLGGERAGNRYYICSRFPRCNYRRLYAEEGKPLSAWVKIGRLFFRS